MSIVLGDYDGEVTVIAVPVPGPQGDKGDQGDQGDKGDQGDPGPYVYTRKTANEVVNNSNVYQDDDHLFIAVEAGHTYEIELCLIVTDPGALGWQGKFAVPAGTTGKWGSFTLALGAPVFNLTTGLATFPSNANPHYYVLKGVAVVTTTGTLQLQWRAVVAGASDVTLGEFSSCLLYTSPSPRDGLLSRMPSSA